MLRIRDAIIEDLSAMLDIYNEAVRSLAATFDLEEQTIEDRRKWFEQHQGRYPLIVAEFNGEVVGYSSLSQFNPKPAYADTCELSVYISSRYRGEGIGSALMKEILHRAESCRFHSVISLITGGNEASFKLHEKFGFTSVGCLKEVGWKFDQWHDVNYYQLLL
ncbi:MAG: GNAT family N-acetyltransferase [Tuberibacillus sp.]